MSKLQHLQEKILDNISSIILLFDAKLNLLYANSSAEDLFSTSVKKLTGANAVDLLTCPNDDVSIVFERALSNDQPFTERELILETLYRKHTVTCTITPVSESNQVLVELQKVDRQLRISKEEHIIEQNKATQEIVRGLAHEIKNPLGGIRGSAQLLESELPSPELKEYTEVIIQEADRLSKLVNQMLGPNQIPQSHEVNIHQVLDRVRNIVVAEAAEGIKIFEDYDPSIPSLMADIDQLIQVFLNIVHNAVQALGSAGKIILKTRIKRQFTIGGTRYKLVLKVDVIDDGPGIKADMLEKIFYPMVTGKADGTGLGLSIAQSLVNQYHGLIECSSRPGETVFSVLLPIGNNHG
ncbi:MAG: nitrogen regulation protein NR(II) [Methylococcales bacterium]|jgi:two-component system, NtrC family, nitrogen regulation sensor histidine kinase GlnL|nr:nitrogen regulation protein NR(II) [Methylococcales bacterium]MBT7445050.1 nitrogen regulation protein NR(II) [Methylococcales bacterium]